MITKDIAVTLTSRTELHYGPCKVLVGPKGGRTAKTETWRVNGACKVWATRPAEFSVPIKYGFKGPYGYLDNSNASQFHLASECVPMEIRK